MLSAGRLGSRAGGPARPPSLLLMHAAAPLRLKRSAVVLRSAGAAARAYRNGGADADGGNGGNGGGGNGGGGATTPSPAPTSLPSVDWRRHHLQVLFVDASPGGARAKLAAALFERVAEWNGYGRALAATAAVVLPPPPVPSPSSSSSLASSTPATKTTTTSATPAGPRLEAHPRLRRPPAVPLATAAALMRQAELLGLPPRDFARPAQLLDVGAADLDMYDLVVGVDAASRAAVLEAVAADFTGQEEEDERRSSGARSEEAAAATRAAAAAEPSQPQPSWPPRTAQAALAYYGPRVRTLAEFGAAALSDDAALARGGFALLPSSMRRALLRPVAEGGSGAEEEEAEAVAHLAAKRRRARRRPRVQWRFLPGGAEPRLSKTSASAAGAGSAGSSISSSMASGDEDDAQPPLTAAARCDIVAATNNNDDEDEDAAARRSLAGLRSAGCLPEPPDLSTAEGAARWRACVRLATWQSAALVQYLISLAPEEGWIP
jgi:hypothetical protein